MLRSQLRTVPRLVQQRAAPQLRTATTSTAQRRFAVYQSQTTNSVVYASMGLAALFGWTAAILYVGGRGKKDKKAHGGKAHAPVTATAEPAAAPAPSSSSSEAPAPAAAADPQASSQSAAFNPETGEINWDCPCLGGMADGPCGEEFKTAFSCFVYSEAEPKGIDCVEKFRGMQECFRKHPDIYGSEAEDLEAEEEDEGFDLVSRAEAALALPDDHFLEKVAEEAPTKKVVEAAASLE
ncbi:hypothetical protein JCM10207_000144 [Rhodosporidiobolus poonsookiae]